MFPVVSPLAIDPAHPFPFIPNLGFSLAVELARVSDGRRLEALLPIPGQLARFVALPGGARFLRLEDLLLMNLDRLFPGYSDAGHCAFRVLRDSDLEVEDEAEDLVREFEHALKRRRRGQVVRLKMTAGATDSLYFRALGVPSSGVSSLFMKAQDGFAHGLNERGPVAGIAASLAQWDSVVRALAK